MDLELSGKAALVAGASRGIGRATAQALSREGAKVCLCARSVEDLERTVAELRHSGGQAVGIAADLSTPEGAEAAVSAT
ncbi:MAG TPA: short-chain dehydrogenase, partial [Myxococcales bacterium]|nr:short-chain dehydrogenase [Myxococcales bacterium]